jgi:ribosomal protein S28E/S33
MSPSEDAAKLSALIAQVDAQIERTIQAGELAQVQPEDVTHLVSGAVKLYAAIAEEAEPGAEIAPVIDRTVSTTEAMVVACALLRAQRLNPFDLALWFQRTAPQRGHESPGS